MKKIVAVNASPRTKWNTAILVKSAAEGAESEGADIKYFNLYRPEKFTGCISCFGCKSPENQGRCVLKDGLSEVLEEIRTADGLIVGSPNYLGDVSAGFRSLYERLIFQSLTYNTEKMNCNDKKIPVLFIMTSNCAEELYPEVGYKQMLEGYENKLNNFVGPTKIMVCGNTLQVNNYEKYNWTLFNPDEKKKRRETEFPKEKQNAYSLGAEIVKNPWQ